MVSTVRTLAVFINSQLAGKIDCNRRKKGTPYLTYDQDYQSGRTATPMSVSMPLCDDNHESSSWVDGLLADRDAIRQQWCKQFNAASSDSLDLLATPLGRDCAGAVQFTPWAAREDIRHHDSGFTTLPEGDLESILLSLRQASGRLKVRRMASASALAGTKQKIGLCYENGDWKLPKGNQPSTHILKSGDSRFPDHSVIEFICQGTGSARGNSCLVHQNR